MSRALESQDFDSKVASLPFWVHCFVDDVLADPGFMLDLGGYYAFVHPKPLHINVLGRYWTSIKFQREEDAVAAQVRFGFNDEQHKRLGELCQHRSADIRKELDDILSRVADTPDLAELYNAHHELGPHERRITSSL